MRTIGIVLGAIILMGAQCESGDVCTPGETQSCVCPSGESGSQTCSYDGERWGGCQCGSTSVGSDAGPPPRSCTPRGAVILSCGCHGPAYEGQVRTATGCCSRQAVSQACYGVGYCAGGTLPWGNRCL